MAFMEFLRVYIVIITVLVGLIVGSFLNVLIYRVPLGLNIWRPGSHCPKCGHPIRWFENIPIFSYLFLEGKCRHCHEPISPRYPIVEALNAVLWFVCCLLYTDCIIRTNDMNWLRFVTTCIICSTLICIFFSDYDHMEIPELFQLILLVCGLVLLLEDVSQNTIMLKVFGFIGAGALFILLNSIYKLIRKRDGIGFGDVELIACAGLILGGYNVIFALILSCVVGGFGLLIYASIKKSEGREFPFAVLLVPGIIVAMFTGNYVINWYFSLLGAI